MEYPLSEIIDRLSILTLKSVRLPANERVALERGRFVVASTEFGVDGQTLWQWLQEQTEINGRIWDLEAELRQGLGLEEIGRRAIQIRELNRERIRRKNEIARKMGEFEETKVDHVSEEARG